MAGRVSVWSDPEVLALVERFVPCADETWRLQRGDDPECTFFRRMADQGHYRGKGGTRQGIYVASPSGRLLASLNSLSADKVAATLEQGLAAWDALPDSERWLPADAEIDASHRWERSCPRGGLVLVSDCRDLPVDLDPSAPRASKTNRDHAWFTRDEVVRAFPGPFTEGHEFELSAAFVTRLARFHVVDNVIGQTLPFAEQEVAGAWMRARVESVHGDVVRLSLMGATRSVADGEWRLGENDWTPRRPWPRGIVSNLRGSATWNTVERRFVAFDLVALATRWGRSQFNGRHGAEDTSCLGIVFSLAPDTPARCVPPGFVDVYDADWIEQPATLAEGRRADQDSPAR